MREPSPATGPTWHPDLPILEGAVFASPDRYQYQGPSPANLSGHWMTVKSGADIGQLIRQSPWVREDVMRRRFRPFDLNAIDPGLTDAEYQLFADIVNDPRPPIRFQLAKAIKQSPRARARPVPVWLSRWCTFEGKNPGLTFPSEAAAGRVRDWLGLPYEEQPLFIIKSRQSVEVKKYQARRPTVLDGISNVLFKHKVVLASDAAGCGTTADIDRLRRRPARPDIIDGGPELVGRRCWFHPRQFECVYLGRAPKLKYDLYGNFHARLLDRRDLVAIVQAVENAFT